MTLDELLASYDPIDVKFMEQFRDGYIPIHREIDPKYLSFIPTKEEVEKILVIPEVINGRKKE